MVATSREEGAKTQVEEIRDLELVNRLDIINLKNEIDQLKITLPQSIEQLPRAELAELAQLADKVKDMKALRQMVDELQELRSRLKDHPEEIRRLHEEVLDLKNRLTFHQGTIPAALICSHCSAPLPAVAKFCRSCGKKVSHNQQ